jgi:hypothetical protein
VAAFGGNTSDTPVGRMTQNWPNRMVVSCEDFHSRDGEMHQPPLDPPVADNAPEATVLTVESIEHLVAHTRIKDFVSR